MVPQLSPAPLTQTDQSQRSIVTVDMVLWPPGSGLDQTGWTCTEGLHEAAHHQVSNAP